ncbi:MAG: S41 family peptidase [Ruminococcaceae bacterium]|nr:S41 family peptidase [Oscillospiraceae bacterium]
MTDNEEKINENKTLRVNGNVLFVGAILLVVITVFVTFLVADRIYYNGALFRKSDSVTFSGENLDEYKVSKFQELLHFIDENYYLEYDVNKVLEGAISGAVAALDDPYSRYLEPGTLNEYVDYITGTYIGAGFSYERSEKGLKILNVDAESSADKAGIIVGDVISEVEGKSVESYTDEELKTLFSKEGTEIKFKIIKANEEVHEATVTISKVSKQSVFVNDYDGVMYVKITQFDDDTGKEFLTAMEKIEKVEHKGIILDLRDNGGGYETQADIVADRILPEGLIAYSENKKGERLSEIKSDATCIESPLVVLINENTASASELVAGAIRDHKKGTLVGEKTYGKALGQIRYDYPEDGSGVVLTVAKYFTPSGECIHGAGISPDIEVSLVEGSEEDAQLEKAFEVLNEGSK